MAKDYTISVGSTGGGLALSQDSGETWARLQQAVPLECSVRALTVYPNDAHCILAGTDAGIFRTDDNGNNWDKLDSPMDGLQIWSIAVDPIDQETIFVGTCPEGFRSKDGGKIWDKLNIGVNMNCPIGTPRTTNLIVDPRDPRTIWAGVEVDGVYKSLDGGDTWLHLPDLGPDPFHGDIHAMALNPGPTTSIYATSPYGIATSTDEGESWDHHHFPKFHENDARSYCRGVLIKADNPDVIFVGNGDFLRGTIGAIQRTTDRGQTWEPVSLPVAPNSLVYWFATTKDLPSVIAAATLYGYVYISEDGGESWKKLKKEFGEVRSLALTPN